MFQKGLFEGSNAPATASAAGYVCDLRQAAEIHKNLAKPGAVFEFHVHKFEGHGLGTRAADQSLGFYGSNALGQLKTHQSAWRQMALAGSNAAAEIQFGDVEPEIFAQIRSGEREVAVELQPGIASLANHRTIGLRVGRFEGEIFSLKTPSF